MEGEKLKDGPKESTSDAAPNAARVSATPPSATDYAICATDDRGRVVNWNTGAEALSGYMEAEKVGRNSSILFTPEDRRRGVPANELKKAEQAGRAEDERWHARRDGTRFWSSGLTMPLRDECGRLRGFVKVARDRTLRK